MASTETKRVLDIKTFVDCVKSSNTIPETLNWVETLARKKDYKKQLSYLKRVMPKDKEITLCAKNSRKVVPKLLDEEQFAY